MTKPFFALLALFLIIVKPAVAQDQVWIQVEAQPTLAQAEARARAYAAEFEKVVGYQLGSGWYAVALGPFAPEDAARTLRNFQLLGDIPADSFIADGGAYGQRYWPVGTVGAPTDFSDLTPVTPSPQVQPAADETPAEARASERLLERPAREDLQIALKWFGYYTSTIDGAFGPGTRRAMSDYQAASGDEVSGILTTAQRARLLDAYRADIGTLGMADVASAETGISLDMPLGQVRFDRFEPPFAHYEGPDGVMALLISQTGNAATLRSLFETMQTLEIVPREGERRIGRDSFELRGENAEIASYTFASLEDGTVKGFTLVWPRTEDRLMIKAAQMMQDSFEPIDGVLDPALADPEAEQAIDLLAGLEIRQPLRTLSGFFVSDAGEVVTSDADLQSCGRITLGETEASLRLIDPTLGIALLTPADRLAPLSVARFSETPGRLQSEVSVAGYPYAGLLNAATLSVGQLADLRGLDGQDSVTRLQISVSAGDAGGPVLDGTGQVLGMLLPRDDTGGQRLPETVNFAASAATLTDLLGAAGVRLTSAPGSSESLAPERLAQLAAGMTVLVSCWE